MKERSFIGSLGILLYVVLSLIDRFFYRVSVRFSFASFPFRNDSDDCDGDFGGIVLTVATVATVALGLLCCIQRHQGQCDPAPGVLGFILITDAVFVFEPAVFDVQILGQGVCRHSNIELFCKLRG